jgi:hypothetical protein
MNSVNFMPQFLPLGLIKFLNFEAQECVRDEWSWSWYGGVVRVSASVATAEKLSMVLEIMLQPIKEISGAITLPGSKSLSNRILLLAALSEVYIHCVVGNSSFLTV